MTYRLPGTLAAAAAGLVLMTTAALASPAQSIVSLNVRYGPGHDFPVVDVLYPGEAVNVETCRSNGWCFIDHRGPGGWVSSRYLSMGPTYYRRVYPVPVRPVYPPYYRPYGQSNSGVTFSFQFGTGGEDCHHYRRRTVCN